MKSLWIPKVEAYIRFQDLAGEEPAIVFIHGLGSSSSSDYPSIAHFQRLSRARLILIDLFGFGYSDRPGNFDYSLEAHAETVFNVIRHLNLAGVYLFGHSMGGAIAVVLAAAHPELIDRLILAEANLEPGRGLASSRIASQSESDYVAEGHKRFIDGIRQGIRETPSLASYSGALEIADPRAMYRSAAGLNRAVGPTQREQLLSMKIPRALIMGEYSLPDPEVDSLRAEGISVFIVPKAGHAMMHENPEGFASALLQSFQC